MTESYTYPSAATPGMVILTGTTSFTGNLPVSPDNPFPVALVTGGTGGGATAAKQDTQITAEQAILATAGATTGAAVVTDANGTIQQYLRGIIVKLIAQLPATLGGKAASASLSIANSFLTAAALGDGSVTTSAETITVANTVQVVEFFNLSANVIWGSWTGTAVASTTGSFPIPALATGVAGYYSSPPGASGSLSIIAVGGASAFTCVGWS